MTVETEDQPGRAIVTEAVELASDGRDIGRWCLMRGEALSDDFLRGMAVGVAWAGTVARPDMAADWSVTLDRLLAAVDER